ncbi:MAG: hypothetical protein R3D34_01840 [Nitratireductor sp.]
MKFGDMLRCMGSYREPWGGHAEYGKNWTYTGSATEQHFSSEDYGLTWCGFHGDGKGSGSA